MSAEPTVMLDVTGENLHAKRYGDEWVYWPVLQRTGAVHTQPGFDQVSALASADFTPDFKVLFDGRGALDAPEGVPSGSVRAVDFAAAEGARPLRVMVGHIYRDGWRS